MKEQLKNSNSSRVENELKEIRRTLLAILFFIGLNTARNRAVGIAVLIWFISTPEGVSIVLIILNFLRRLRDLLSGSQ